MSDGNELIYDFKSRSDASGLVCKEPSLTVQADAEDADINTIVRRFGITGSMPQGVRVPEYVDYDQVFDYHSAQLAILEADANFMAMPAEVRAKFDNDPGKFLLVASDPGNIDFLRELGLAVPKPEVVNGVSEVGTTVGGQVGSPT